MLDSTLMLDPNNNAVTRDGSIVENRLLIPGKLGDLLHQRVAIRKQLVG